MTDKKTWFIAINSKTWFPVSWEGWLMLIGQILLVLLIIWGNKTFSGDGRSFSLARDFPLILELLVVVGLGYWFSRGHVEKRY